MEDPAATSDGIAAEPDRAPPAEVSHPQLGPYGAGDSPAPSIEAIRERLLQHQPDARVALVDRAHAALQRAADELGDALDIAPALHAAYALAGQRLDAAAVAGALALPLLAELGEPPERLAERVGAEVARLVEGVHRLTGMRWDRIEEEAAENLRKMFLAMARDIRVVLIALAFRVQTMRGVSATADADEARRLARETLDVYAPLANRLGIWQAKWELEDGALRVLEPQVFAELTHLLHEARGQRDAYIGRVLETLKEKLAEEGIAASVKGRSKHVYSIYKKMQRKQIGFDQIFDVLAVRVLVERVGDCYAALGMVHSLWTPLPGEFDDYIARPKDNLYQSLHTAVLGPEGRPLEVQIRTHEMHQFAEFGVAAHWAYKEAGKSGKAGKPRDRDKFMVLRQLMDWEREVTDPHAFVESLKTDIFEDQVYVFTPNGDVVDLPVGSTPLDFAYRIHTEVGHRCRGARINDEIQSLDYQLKTGDRVEILTQKQSHPSRDWMNPNLGYLHTTSARQKVRQWFRAQSRDTAVTEGKALVEHELARLELRHATLERISETLKYTSADDLFAAVGFGDKSPHGIASAALALERELAPPEDPVVPPSEPAARRGVATKGLSLHGVDDILGSRARCCNPVPGDNVVGFITRGRGMVIHRRDCAHVVDPQEPERLVAIDWGGGSGERHPVDVVIRATDRPGLLRDVSNLVAIAGVNMTSARAEGHRDGTASFRMRLEFASAEQVVKVLQKIDNLRDVLEVRRVGR